MLNVSTIRKMKIFILLLLIVVLIGCTIYLSNKSNHENSKTSVELERLEKPDNIDTKGWNIEFQQLLSPKRGVYPHINLIDKFYESPDSRYACLFYTVDEYRMGAYRGLIGIFENKQNPKLLVNPKDQWFSFNGNRPLGFESDILFLRILAYNEDENLSGMPFVLVDLSKRKFGFIDFDFTSIYYSLVFVSGTTYKINLDTPEEIKNRQLANRDSELIDLSDIQFYGFDQFDNALELYWDQKKD